MTDLTDKWKKGELPSGWYWCKCYDEEIKILYYDGDCFELDDPETKNYYFFLKKDCAEIAILAEAPSYEEWQVNENYIDYLKQCISVYESKDKQATETSIAYNELLEENTKLKEQINKYILDSINRGTANAVTAVKEFGMPERIEELVKENAQLKTDCHTLAQKLLQVKPELREWLEVNFKEYL